LFDSWRLCERPLNFGRLSTFGWGFFDVFVERPKQESTRKKKRKKKKSKKR
jgi:hypothetical protein